MSKTSVNFPKSLVSPHLSADVKQILLQDWEYYDDSTVLTEFWQKFVDEERDFSK